MNSPRKTLVFLFSSLAVSIGAALIIAFLVIMPLHTPPGDELQMLFLFMSAMGIMTTLAAYLLYRWGVLQWFSSLRWTLLAMIVLTVLLFFGNVWLTARFMFISTYDLIVATALLVFAGLVSVIAMHFIARTFIERIQDLCMAAEQLAAGELDTRLQPRGNDELAELAEMFNFMAAALQNLDEQKRMLDQNRRDLIAWVSHDLRTPLASIRAMNEAIIDGVVDDPADIARYTGNIQKEVHHLSHLIDDLFELSQLDAGRIEVSRELTSLRDLISDTLGSMTVKAAKQQIDLQGEVRGDVDMIRIAPDKIQRTLYNLLDNAIRHTPPGGAINLCSEPMGDGQVKISVHNTGSWVADEQLAKIFESFYRGEASRAQEGDGYRGTGLGLAIARGFVEAHGGRIWAESSEQDGVTFSFVLPVV